MKDIVKVEGNRLMICSTQNIGMNAPCPTEKLHIYIPSAKDSKMKDTII